MARATGCQRRAQSALGARRRSARAVRSRRRVGARHVLKFATLHGGTALRRGLSLPAFPGFDDLATRFPDLRAHVAGLLEAALRGVAPAQANQRTS